MAAASLLRGWGRRPLPPGFPQAGGAGPPLCFLPAGTSLPLAVAPVGTPRQRPQPTCPHTHSRVSRKGNCLLDFLVPRNCYQLKKFFFNKILFTFPPTPTVAVRRTLFLGSLLKSIEVPGSNFLKKVRMTRMFLPRPCTKWFYDCSRLWVDKAVPSYLALGELRMRVRTILNCEQKAPKVLAA